jgi:2-polyprenyl-6-methoxyphenol hydroxylase-like FAD-dependent oxidoreductase
VPNTVGADHFMEFMGHGMALGLLPVSRDELFLWLSVHARPGQPSAAADLTGFKALISRFSHPLVLGSLEQLTDPGTVLCTDIHEVTMEEYYSGRCVLLCDAAHAMSPSMGTGSAMAMGDAIILARELGRVARGELDYPAALDSYYRHRFPKVEAMRALTRGVDADHHAGELSIVRYRDARLEAWLHDGQAAADMARSLGGEL